MSTKISPKGRAYTLRNLYGNENPQLATDFRVGLNYHSVRYLPQKKNLKISKLWQTSLVNPGVVTASLTEVSGHVGWGCLSSPPGHMMLSDPLRSLFHSRVQ
ncbi:hypothetical protein BASA81_010307 [Batrachochytrium salamandrivorans]|nr:hypothetical protein BASA81_010307 [Batrachochytrium salamandrivorans]